MLEALAITVLCTAQAPAVVPSARNIPVTLAADGRAISLTLGENVGAAVFRNGDWIMVVFDQPEALDLAALRRSEIFRAMETREGNDSTTLQMRLAQPATLRPRRNGNTWVLEAYSAIFWRDQGLTGVMLPCALLLALGLVSLGGAQILAARRARI